MIDNARKPMLLLYFIVLSLHQPVCIEFPSYVQLRLHSEAMLGSTILTP